MEKGRKMCPSADGKKPTGDAILAPIQPRRVPIRSHDNNPMVLPINGPKAMEYQSSKDRKVITWDALVDACSSGGEGDGGTRNRRAVTPGPREEAERLKKLFKRVALTRKGRFQQQNLVPSLLSQRLVGDEGDSNSGEDDEENDGRENKCATQLATQAICLPCLPMMSNHVEHHSSSPNGKQARNNDGIHDGADLWHSRESFIVSTTYFENGNGEEDDDHDDAYKMQRVTPETHQRPAGVSSSRSDSCAFLTRSVDSPGSGDEGDTESFNSSIDSSSPDAVGSSRNSKRRIIMVDGENNKGRSCELDGNNQRIVNADVTSVRRQEANYYANGSVDTGDPTSSSRSSRTTYLLKSAARVDENEVYPPAKHKIVEELKALSSQFKPGKRPPTPGQMTSKSSSCTSLPTLLQPSRPTIFSAVGPVSSSKAAHNGMATGISTSTSAVAARVRKISLQEQSASSKGTGSASSGISNVSSKTFTSSTISVPGGHLSAGTMGSMSRSTSEPYSIIGVPDPCQLTARCDDQVDPKFEAFEHVLDLLDASIKSDCGPWKNLRAKSSRRLELLKHMTSSAASADDIHQQQYGWAAAEMSSSSWSSSDLLMLGSSRIRSSSSNNSNAMTINGFYGQSLSSGVNKLSTAGKAVIVVPAGTSTSSSDKASRRESAVSSPKKTESFSNDDFGLKYGVIGTPRDNSSGRTLLPHLFPPIQPTSTSPFYAPFQHDRQSKRGGNRENN